MVKLLFRPQFARSLSAQVIVQKFRRITVFGRAGEAIESAEGTEIGNLLLEVNSGVCCNGKFQYNYYVVRVADAGERTSRLYSRENTSFQGKHFIKPKSFLR